MAQWFQFSLHTPAPKETLVGKGRGDAMISPVQPQKSPSSPPCEHIFRVGAWPSERGPGFKLKLCKN